MLIRKDMKNGIKIFEERKVRTVWDDETEEWYFSIIDVVGILTDSPNPNNYWKVLKSRLKKEGNELVTKCNQLKEFKLPVVLTSCSFYGIYKILFPQILRK